MEIHELTIPLVQEGYRNGRLTAAGLTAAYFDRIKAFDRHGPRINSVMALSDSAIAEAEALDKFFRETGQFKGKLHGIPILVKDQADTKGLRTQYGSGATSNNIPDKDATVVHKLKEAGAIVLGKTSMSEWAACWFSTNGANGYQFTQNPYKSGHDVGASSGGSAAAIASNFAVVALAEDTGGSIRLPASYCNVVGIRVTPGLVSRAGFCPLIKSQDTPGPLARNVMDCALMLDCMVGFDPQDDATGLAASISALGIPRGGSYASGLGEGDKKLAAARIGVLRELFGPDSDEHCHAVNKVVNSALDKIRSTGTECIDVNIESLNDDLTYGQIYFQQSRHDINSFLATKPHLPQDIADMVPRIVPEDKPFHDILCGLAHGPKDPKEDPTYLDRLARREGLKRKTACLIAAHQLDALVFPDVKIPPPAIAEATSDRFRKTGYPTNTLLSSTTRLPAMSIPVGFTDEGLPVGLEILGLEFQEQKLLELGRGVESLLGARRKPNF
ncbi:hypothetical protein COL516b_009899 [Colletotrichum fioriniae]|nr:uncharacterized protein COL516b_009899 [Colletotrichum fioriniae]KAJ0298513.1 hypothetical protein COL516b_009899 [Colletotrichum fioriniae]